MTGICGCGEVAFAARRGSCVRIGGLPVIGAAVAGDAARTLGEEAAIDARVVAELLADLAAGRDWLDQRNVLMIDEAGTIGAAQAKAFFEQTRDTGVRVLLLWDASQHESVGREAELRGLAEQHGALDMRESRRARRFATRRRARSACGVVSRAPDILREHCAVREHRTHEEARAALVRSWVEAKRAGKSALFAASHDDVRAMNGLAREALRDRLGEERTYATDFGERAFAIGDVLVSRERAHGGVNGERYTLLAHRDDGRLELRRERDGVAVFWDQHEHRAIDHGYVTPSHGLQGRTVDAVLALASSADARRGLYVGVTQAREDVTIAYGKDDVRDFGELLVSAQRNNGKMLVRDVEQQLEFAHERTDVGSLPWRLSALQRRTPHGQKTSSGLPA